MQVDDATIAKYQKEAPELLSFVEAGTAGNIMLKNPQTGFCTKLQDDGWCGLHKEYGEKFLGDACNFYPRVTRRINNEIHQSVALSCPEVVRLVVGEHVPSLNSDASSSALAAPYSLKNYTGDMAMHAQLLQSLTAAAFCDNIRYVVTTVCGQEAASELAAPDNLDTYRLLNTLAVLIYASKGRAVSPRLVEVIGVVEHVLQIKVDFENARILSAGGGLPQVQELWQRWAQIEHKYDDLLNKILHAQLQQNMFPISGLGASEFEKCAILVFKMALVRLCVAAEAVSNGDADVVKIVQSLSRFLDHLASPQLLISSITDNGWVSISRLLTIF